MITKQIWRVSQKRFVSDCQSAYRSTLWRMDKRMTTYYASFADKPVYLKELSEKETDSETVPEPLKTTVSSVFQESQTVIVAETTGVTCNDVVADYVRSCLTLHPLFRSNACNNYEVVLGALLDPQSEVRDSLKRCLFFAAKRAPAEDEKFPPSTMVMPKDVRLYKLVQNGNINVFEKKKLCGDDPQEENNKLKKFELVCPLDPKTGDYSVAPMFRSINFRPVYHSLERTLDVLQMLSDIPQVQELLEVKGRELPEQFSTVDVQSQMKHAFVVVEGMDATGKTTLTKTIGNKLQAVRYCTPPPCIQHLRRYFDGLPEIVRRAYYSLGNYIVSVQIARECQHKPVIMDRYWHSTTSYGIANETSLSDLPPEGHMTYNWPDDLLEPNCVLFLTVSEEVRKQRMNQREEAMTYEERSLDRDSLFRQRLCEAYKRMRNPGCMEIDASGSREKVVELALTALLEHGVSLT